AYVAGYSVLPRSWASLVPQQPWQWLPLLGIAAAAVGAATPIAGRYAPARWLALGMLCAGAAYVRTPTWPIFGGSRPLSVGIGRTYLFCLAAAIELGGPRSLSDLFVGLLALAAGALAVWVGAAVSLRFAQLAAIAAAGLAGCWLTRFAGSKHSVWSLAGMVP